jgi:hypothetical protein
MVGCSKNGDEPTEEGSPTDVIPTLEEEPIRFSLDFEQAEGWVYVFENDGTMKVYPEDGGSDFMWVGSSPLSTLVEDGVEFPEGADNKTILEAMHQEWFINDPLAAEHDWQTEFTTVNGKDALRVECWFYAGEGTLFYYIIEDGRFYVMQCITTEENEELFDDFSKLIQTFEVIDVEGAEE